MNIYDLISRAQKLRKETQLDSVSPDRVGGLQEDTLKYINEFQLLASSPSLHKIYASVSAMQSDKSPKSDLTGKPLKPGQLVVIVPANQTDATAGDVYRYDGPSGNTSAWTFVAKIGAVPADAELSATSTNPPQNKVVTEKLTELESEVDTINKGQLIAPPNYTEGYKLNTDGALVADSASRVSEYIPWNGGTIVKVFRNTTTSGYLCGYDADNKFITGVYWGLATYRDINDADLAKASYLRFDFGASAADVRLLDTSGQVVWETQETSQLNLIDLSYMVGKNTEDIHVLSEDVLNNQVNIEALESETTDLRTKTLGGNNYTEGGYFDESGNIVANAGYSYSDYIDISAEVGNTLYFWHGFATNGYIILYDAKKAVIDYYGNTSSVQRGLKIEEGWAYARFSFVKDYEAYISKAGGIIWEKGYVGGIVEDITKNANDITNNAKALNIAGRDFIQSKLVVSNGIQTILNYHTKEYGKGIGFRIVHSTTNAEVKASIYNNGTAFNTFVVKNEWVYWQSETQIDGVYIRVEGGVESDGEIALEIAYGDYFWSLQKQEEYKFQGISLNKSDVSKYFPNQVRFSDSSLIEIEISNLQSTSEHPYVYVYGIYSSDGAKKERLRSIAKDGDVIKVGSFGHESLFGIFFWNNNQYSVNFDAIVRVRDVKYAIQDVTSYNDIPVVPSYYNEYIQQRQWLIRRMMKDLIVDGDAFYFITDTHWEWNAKKSPAVIGRLNEKLSIPRLFHGGDVYHDGIRDDGFSVECINLLRNAMKSNKVYVTDGNHEFLEKSATYGDIFCESRIYLDDVVYGGEHKNFYYTDNMQKKIRYIVLASYGEYVDGSITYYLQDQQQQAWLRDVALNVDDGWKIFIFTHTLCDYNLPDFTEKDVAGATSIYEIINEYGGKGEILACIIGHTHADGVVFGKCKCPIIIATSDHNYPFEVPIGNGQYIYDLSELIEPRNCGTINEQAFECVLWDKKTGAIHCVRIGSRAMNRCTGFVGDAQVDIRTILKPLPIGQSITLNSPLGITSWETSDSSKMSVSDGTCRALSKGCVAITGIAENGMKQSWFINIVA